METHELAAESCLLQGDCAVEDRSIPCERCGHSKLQTTSTRFCSSALLSPFLGEGPPTKDYRRKVGTLILPSLLQDLDDVMILSHRFRIHT